jgi:hypothetical protein
VTVGGQRFQEMHVDGGAFAQAYLFPPGLAATRVERVRAGLAPMDVTAHVVLNARLALRATSVDRRAVAIAARAISTLIAASGRNDVFRIEAAIARTRGVRFRLAAIGEDFTTESDEPFARSFMNALFDYGFAQGRSGTAWRDTLPG